ncbi:MAG TPA: winged helix-turn-helix transcriptional regulator [Acidimicrobiales bacterium]|nr:winged helix-turn-helix transcriptional regulator [Acidimicrobiales bacterium]
MDPNELDGYGQYCPIARAVSILEERWTLLIVRDLLVGTTRFNDLARGLPGISRTLLSNRLRKLERCGIVERDGTDYVLTPAGRDLEGVVFGLGDWGAKWAFGPPTRQELDPELLLWWAKGRIDAERLPERRVVVGFVLRDPTFHAWLVVDDAGPSVCKTDPGFEVDATLEATVAVLSEVWLGRRELLGAMRDGDVRLSGRSEVVRALPEALQLSPVSELVAAATAAGRAGRASSPGGAG